MMDNVLECVRKTIADLINCGEDEITPEARLVEDLGFESIDFLELAMTVSSRYKVELDEDGLYLSSFRSLLRNASPEEAMDRLRAAYPHLPVRELRQMLETADQGNVLKVSHVASYLQYRMQGSPSAQAG